MGQETIWSSNLPLPCEATLDVGTRGSSARFGAVGYETIGIGFLNPLVNNRTRPIVDHFVAENGCLVLKSARRGSVASCLTEEDGDGEVDCLRLEVGVSRGRVGRLWREVSGARA